MQDDKKILTVLELTRYIRFKLEDDALLGSVWVRGEISNFKHHTSGHMYFTLKDADSRIRCVMFASQNRYLSFIPREGSRVLAHGAVSVYERDGQYQFYVTEMQPDGIGSLYLAFEQLKKKLEAEGLFSKERKKAIPLFPRTVGVITSPTGAAVRDILTTLKRRMPSVKVLIYPVHVQGKQAAPSIVKAIETMNRLGEADVLIVGRGGGSLEELWAFNEEIVARSIAASNIPVISAVGHETDFTIADFAADVRAATPTAAAELAVPHHLELKQQLHHLSQRIRRGLYAQLGRKREALARLRRSSLFKQPQRHLLRPAERLDRLKEQMAYKAGYRLNREKERHLKLEQRLMKVHPGEKTRQAASKMDHLHRQLIRSVQTFIKDRRQALVTGMKQLDALSPLKVMQRGYSLVYDEQESALITSIEQVQPGDMVKVRLKDGRLDCQIWSMREERDYGRDGK